jgi:hypothetical protein
MPSRDELERFIKKFDGKTLKTVGSAIAGEKIIAQARKIVPAKKPVAGTSTHKMQQTDLHTNALCVIDRAFRKAEGTPETPEPKKA